MNAQSIEEAWAERLLAREARLVCAKSAMHAMVELGLVLPGDRIVVCADSACSKVYEGLYSAYDVVFVEEPTVEAFLAASGNVHSSYEGEGPRLWWLVESLGGEGLRVPDLRGLGKAARERGALLAVDNTRATCFGCNPLRLRAVLAFERFDRFYDAKPLRPLAAIAVARSQFKRHRVDEAARCVHTLLERCTAPAIELSGEEAEVLGQDFSEDAFRMQIRFDHARAFAEYAAANEMIKNVAYPGLSVHCDHCIATGVLEHGFGSCVCIEPAGPGAALRLFRELGGIEGEPLQLSGGTTVCAKLGESGESLLINVGEGSVFELIDQVDSALRRVCIG